MWKRILQIVSAIVMVLIIFLLLFGDFSREGKYNDGKTHVQYWFITGQKEEVPYSVRKFNSLQDSIVIEATSIPWQEHEKKILTAILSGNPPDIVSQFIPVVKWASRMALMPLDKFIERDNFDSSIFFPFLWQEMQWQGHVFAIPVATASYALYYNKRLFKESGLNPENPPETWDELKYYSKRLVKYDDKGKLIQVGFLPFFQSSHVASQQSVSASVLMAWELGASFLNEEGTKVSLTDPAIMKSTQWLVDYYKDYSMDEILALIAGLGYGDQHGFVSEKVAMMLLSNAFSEHIERYNPNLDYGVAMVPVFEGCPPATSSGSWWVAIPRGAKNPDAAWEFMKFMVKKDIQLEDIESTEENLLPSNRYAATDKRFLKDRETEIFIESLKFAHSPAIVPLVHDVFWREYYNALERAVHEMQSVEKSLKQAERVIQDELDSALEYDQYVRNKMGFFD